MAITLAPELLAAQSAQSRKPIIELIAGRLDADYPFTGTPLANPDIDDHGVSLSLILPGGEFAVFFAGDGELRYVVSDTAVSEFSDYVVVDDNAALSYLDGFVMNDGNLAVVAQNSTSATALYVISPAGAKISETQIGSIGNLHGCSVSVTSTGYALVYSREVGGIYALYLATSTDFVTWGSASTISISGLDSSHPIKNPRLYRLVDGSFVLVYAYATIVNDVSTVYNIQYSTSADLVTWVASAVITDTSTISEDYVAPDVVQKADGSLFLAAQKSSTYLTMTSIVDGWNTSDSIGITSAWVDPVAGKLYVISRKTYVGFDPFYGAAVIDIATWSVDAFYDENTSPPVPSWFAETDNSPTVANSGGMGILFYSKAVCVIDYGADTITGYYFADYSVEKGAEYTQNIDSSWDDIWNSAYENPSLEIVSAYVHDSKLWLGFDVFTHYTGAGARAVFGYIDLTQTTAPYEFVVCGGAALGAPEGFEFYPDNDIVLTWTDYYYRYGPRLNILNVSGAGLKYYHYTTHSDFPRLGVSGAVLVEGTTIYASPEWSTEYAADVDKWGLMEVDINTDVIRYYYPDWITSPGNYLDGVKVVDEDAGEIIIRTGTGVIIFNYNSKSWERLESSVSPELPTVPGLPTTTASGMAYDPINRYLFYGDIGHVFLVPRDGLVSTIEYITEEEGVFSSPSQLAVGNQNVAPSLALNADDETYATWTNASADNVEWDKAGASVNLDDYLTGETSLEWAIDAPGRLSFSLASGHLADPHNDNSILRTYLTKGKSVSVRFGENIGGTKYWANQGTYIVRSLSMQYQRGKHPIASVTCEDARSLWSENQVVVANVDSLTPEYALRDLIPDNSNIAVANIPLPSFPLSFAFDAQWLDTDLDTIINDISYRFQHFPYMGLDGNLDFRPITTSASISNTYATGEVIEYSPDDSYSDLTNRWIVTGESLNDFEVVYEEERLASLSGTVGWWGYHKDKQVYYSKDEEKRAKSVRLKVIESSMSIPDPFKLAGEITEKISYIDPYHKYCTVEIKAPDLTAVLVTAIGIYLTGNAVGDGIPPMGGMTIPVGRYMEKGGLILAILVLGSVGNYQYEVYGTPLGYVKRSYQNSADDEDLQQELGMVVETKEEGFLCYTSPHCKTVAEFKKLVGMAQRNRVTLTKIAHLQDEVGDTTAGTHPYTGQTKKQFITNLRRRYKPSTGQNDGYFNDEIEGWVV